MWDSHTHQQRDEVFAALMKKGLFGGEEFLSALKVLTKGLDIIFNTLPFPGHVSGDSAVRPQPFSIT